MGAAQITLEWDPNTESDLAGYKLHYGTASQDYSSTVDAGSQTSYTLTDLEDSRTYFFTVTAYDLMGQESGYSPELSFNIPSPDTQTNSGTSDETNSENDTDMAEPPVVDPAADVADEEAVDPPVSDEVPVDPSASEASVPEEPVSGPAVSEEPAYEPAVSEPTVSDQTESDPPASESSASTPPASESPAHSSPTPDSSGGSWTGEASSDLTVGGAAEGPHVERTINTLEADSLTVRLSRRNTYVKGRIYVSLEVPSVSGWGDLMWFRPMEEEAPPYIHLAKVGDVFLNGVADLYYYEGILSATTSDVELALEEIPGLKGQILVFKSWLLENGKSLNVANMKLLQSVKLVFN